MTFDIGNANIESVGQDTARIAADAVKWIEANKDAIGTKSTGLLRDLRRREMLANRYARSARRPVGVGVFGASQAGKSFLVSALAHKGSEPLTVVLDKEYDFLKHINPEDDGEATGLVTRFTVRTPVSPNGFPVSAQLLNQVDLVKILLNTYFLDFDATQESVPTAMEIEAALSQAEAKALGSAVDPLEEVEIDDLRRYFVSQFSSRQTARAFEETGYWTRLEKLAPRLKIDERVKLYAFLWGQLEPFSAVYRQLYAVLEALCFPDQCFCSIDALIPRETSVINVKALFGLSAPTGETIKVSAPAGQICNVPRSHLTAIIAELVMQIKDHPWPFLEHTDLLDFPGARSREMNDNAEAYVKKPGTIADLFRRGKVAYLFDRYCDENELSGMLLCLPPGNQEVRTIPGLVAVWIRALQGASAAARSKRETTLFVVMTKFDKRFEESKGKGEVDWTSALKAPLTDYFGAISDNWAQEWHPGLPFNNVFWLRNPSFIAHGLMKYDKNRQEVDLADPERISKIKQDYLRNETVKRHFRDPEKAWDEAFRFNDGGISYLADSLAHACHPELKLEQIRVRITELRSEISTALSEFHVSSDEAVEKEKRIGTAHGAIENMAECLYNQRFGHFLDALQVSNEELQSLFRRLSIAGEVVTTARPDVGTLFDLIGLMRKSTTQEIVRDKHADLARAAMTHWAERVQQLPQLEKKMKFLKVNSECMEVIVRELLAGAKRIDLEQLIAAEMRAEAPAIEQSSASMLKAAITAAENIDRYIWKLHQDMLPPKDRAVIKRTAQPVFQPRAAVQGDLKLPENRGAFYQDFIADWLASFLYLVEKNAEGRQQSGFSAESSIALRTIMNALAA